jgi:hypothetical protein
MTPEVETHAEIRRTGHRWIDLSAAGCALILSITSVFVAIRHGHTMERMAEANARLVEANSWPLLQTYNSDEGASGERVFSLIVSNFGVGPAKVESLEVFWKGRAMRDDFELLRSCCIDGPAPGLDELIHTSDLHGMVLRAGDVRRLLEFSENPSTAALTDRVHGALPQIVYRACYCSVFDECWMSDLRTLHPPPIKQCPVPQVPFAGRKGP